MKIIPNLHLLLYYSVFWGNRTLNCPLGVQVPTGNLYYFKLIQVK